MGRPVASDMHSYINIPSNRTIELARPMDTRRTRRNGIRGRGQTKTWHGGRTSGHTHKHPYIPSIHSISTTRPCAHHTAARLTPSHPPSTIQYPIPSHPTRPSMCGACDCATSPMTHRWLRVLFCQFSLSLSISLFTSLSPIDRMHAYIQALTHYACISHTHAYTPALTHRHYMHAWHTHTSTY